jgi:hypothetical protein
MRRTRYISLAGLHVRLWTCEPCSLQASVSLKPRQYPSYEKLNALVKTEAEHVVERLRDHPSVVIFAGNNEDYQIAESEGVMDYDDNSGDYMNSKFPGYVDGNPSGGKSDSR